MYQREKWNICHSSVKESGIWAPNKMMHTQKDMKPQFIPPIQSEMHVNIHKMVDQAMNLNFVK